MLKTFHSFKSYDHAIRYIADHISPINAEELQVIAPGSDPFQALMQAGEKSETGFIFFDFDGYPRAIGGVFSDRNIWFVITDKVTRRELVPWLKHSLRLLKELHQKYRTLWGHSYHKNGLSRLWMKWNGFDFAPPGSHANYTIDGHEFYYFQRNA